MATNFVPPKGRMTIRRRAPGQGVIEGDFFVREARLLAARSCRPNVLGKLDQFFDHPRRLRRRGSLAQPCMALSLQPSHKAPF